MARPRRLYLNSKGKYYYIVDGKKKYIKVPEGMSQKQIQTINIKNIIAGPARRLKKRRKKVAPVFQKKLVPGEDMQKSVIKTEGGLPTYIFTPQKKFLSLGDIATKSDDTSNTKLIDLLKGAIPLISEGFKKQLALPAPESKSQVSEDVLNYMKIIGDVRKTLEEVKESSITDEIDRQKRLKEIEEEVVVPTSVGKRGRKSGTTVEEGYALSVDEMIPYYLELEKKGKNINDITRTDLKSVYKGKKTITSFNMIEATKKIARQKKRTPISSVESTPFRGSGDDGLYNDQIEKIMKERIKNYVPVVPRDKLMDLLDYVKPNDEFFSAVINTEPSTSHGRHWICIVVDNRDDYQSVEFFDPLAENDKIPNDLLKIMKIICRRMNRERYFKVKFNKIRRQSFLTSNCGYHVCRFIEDRYKGIPFSEASGYDDYIKRQRGDGYEAPDDSKDGEKDIKPYISLLKKNFSSYL